MDLTIPSIAPNPLECRIPPGPKSIDWIVGRERMYGVGEGSKGTAREWRKAEFQKENTTDISPDKSQLWIGQ